jgi:hypothetical protein
VTTTKKRLSRVQRHASLEMTGAVCTTCTGAMETLASPHRSWYLRLRRGQLCIVSGVLQVGRTFTSVRHSILMRLQQSDPIFNMGVDFIRPAFNLEPNYRVTLFTRGEWIRGPEIPPVMNRLVWFIVGSRTDGIGAGVYRQSVGRRLSCTQVSRVRRYSHSSTPYLPLFPYNTTPLSSLSPW